MSLKEIQKEIDWYRPSKQIANLILSLGRLDFEFEGHGTDLYSGEEYFSLSKKIGLFNIFINLSNDSDFMISVIDIENSHEALFINRKYKLSQTLAQAKRYLKLLKELQK